MHYIIINSCVGSQRCTGIELFIDDVSVAKAIYEKKGVVFCNSRFYSTENPPCDLNEYHLGFFSRNLFRLFLNAKNIKLRIFRTYKSVPCLSSVQVWGTVSKLCSATTKQTIEKLINKNCNTEISNTTVKDKEKYPEDFKDDLTNELMTIPMTLPSGKTIDQTTLDKYNLNEKEFGRKPGDPFTGIKFNEKLKPILNVALKSRIDMFLLANSANPEYFNLKRTLGRTSAPSTSVAYKKIKLDSIGQDDNLEKAINLAKTDSNFVSFTSEEENKSNCVKCGKKENIFYKIPCEHLYCRLCMLEICEKLECSQCRSQFNKSDVTKVHV